MIIRIFDPTEPGLQASMHLTPPPARAVERTRRFHRRLVDRFRVSGGVPLIIAILVVASCTTAPRVAVPAPPPAPTEPTLPSTTQTFRPSALSPDASTYDVISQVTTTETASTGDVVRDSIEYREALHAILALSAGGLASVSLRSDSGYIVVRGRDMAPEVAARFKRPIAHVVRQSASTPRIVPDSVAGECSSVATLASPLLPALALRLALQTTKEPRAARDSLVYSSCQAGTIIRNVIEINSATFEPSSGVADTIRYEIRGAVAADSTRTLPMRLTGQIKGEAFLVHERLQRSLPVHAQVVLQLDLRFENSLRTQRVQQRVVTDYRPRS